MQLSVHFSVTKHSEILNAQKMGDDKAPTCHERGEDAPTMPTVPPSYCSGA